MQILKILNIKNKTLLKKEIEKSYTEGVYSDSSINRKLGRVGMPYKNIANIFNEGYFENLKKEGFSLMKGNFELSIKEFTEKYNKSFAKGVDILEISKNILSNFENQNNITKRIKLLDDGDVIINIHNKDTSDYEKGLDIEFNICGNDKEKYFDIDNLYLPKEDRHKGIVFKFFENLYKNLSKNKFKEIRLEAAREGVYNWMKYPFKIDNISLTDIKVFIENTNRINEKEKKDALNFIENNINKQKSDFYFPIYKFIKKPYAKKLFYYKGEEDEELVGWSGVINLNNK